MADFKRAGGMSFAMLAALSTSFAAGYQMEHNKLPNPKQKLFLSIGTAANTTLSTTTILLVPTSFAPMPSPPQPKKPKAAQG